jgi:hypothetical protein
MGDTSNLVPINHVSCTAYRPPKLKLPRGVPQLLEGSVTINGSYGTGCYHVLSKYTKDSNSMLLELMDYRGDKS